MFLLVATRVSLGTAQSRRDRAGALGRLVSLLPDYRGKGLVSSQDEAAARSAPNKIPTCRRFLPQVLRPLRDEHVGPWIGAERERQQQSLRAERDRLVLGQHPAQHGSLRVPPRPVLLPDPSNGRPHVPFLTLAKLQRPCSGQACPPNSVPVSGSRRVSPALLGGGLPSLDVHLFGRRAILHLPLGGGACGAEKHRSADVSGGERPWRTHPDLSRLCPPGPQELSLTSQQAQC